MIVKKGVKELVEEAEEQVVTLTPAEVDDKSQGEGVRPVDLRDIRELKRDGIIPGSLHVPRGMLEFWIDPESPYYRRDFDEIDEVILFCNKGSRSALAALSLKTMSNFTEKLEGTYLDRHTVKNAEKAGFKILSHKNVYLDIVKALVAKPG